MGQMDTTLHFVQPYLLHHDIEKFECNIGCGRKVDHTLCIGVVLLSQTAVETMPPVMSKLLCQGPSDALFSKLLHKSQKENKDAEPQKM